MAYFNRGKKLFFSNKAKVFDIKHLSENEQPTVKFSSIVKGTRQYKQDIIIKSSKSINVIDGHCSCPVGYNCKHVAAACLELQLILDMDDGSHLKDKSENRLKREQQFEREDPAYANWLSVYEEKITLTEAIKEPEFEKQYHRFHLFNSYNSKFSSNINEINELDVYNQGYTVKGRLKKPRKISLTKYLGRDNSWSSEPISSKSQQLLQMVTEVNWGDASIQFKDEAGFIALSQLIETKHTHFKEYSQRLTWLNEDFELNLKYINEDKRHHLILDYPKINNFLVFCEPPILINFNNHTAQRVNSSVNSKLLLAIEAMPPTTDVERFEQLYDFINKDFFLRKDLFKKQHLTQKTTASVPIINPPNIPEVEDFKPKIIKVKPLPVLSFEKTKTDIFNVRFTYGDYFATPSADTRIIREKIDGIKVEIHRNLEAEIKHLKLIEPYLTCMHNNYDVPDKGFYNFDNSTATSNMNLFEKQIHFQTVVMPLLESNGWELRLEENRLFDLDQVDGVEISSEVHNEWFELGFNMVLGKNRSSMIPVMQYLLQSYESSDDFPAQLFVPGENQQVLQFSKQQIAPIFDTFIQLYGQNANLPDRIEIQRFDTHLIHGLDNQTIQWKGSKETLELSKKLKEFKGIQIVEPPKGLNATLRTYQQFGLDWLNFLREFNFNGVLADDMGLGKTLQTLAFLLKLKENQQLTAPILIIVPTSLIGNWKAEAKRFTPDLTMLTLQGSERKQYFDNITKFDIVLTSYPLVVRDDEVLQDYVFEYIILDEAQKIKNPKTKLYHILQKLKSKHRIALTGTPIENHTGELWSLFNFVMPGFLDNLPRFKKFYQNPIEKEANLTIQQQLTQKVSPFLLRRTKKEVLTDLPDKTEIIKFTEFESEQANFYETIRLTMETKIKDIVANKGLGKSHIQILDALLKLRQVCCDPSLVKLDNIKIPKQSSKLDLLMDLLDELLEAESKIIIFSQFTSMLQIIQTRLEKHNIKYSLLTGQTKKREEAINDFKEGSNPIFLISLKAGGVGLNLTEANTVIHYDPWWNPAVENQATDRAYRIGQNKDVFVYKLIASNTIEEKILAMQEKKQKLQNQIYDKNNKKDPTKMTGEDLISLLKRD